MRLLALLTIFFYSHCLDLPRTYHSIKETICHLEEFSDHWELTTDADHHYFIRCNDERGKLRAVFKRWAVGSYITIWASKQIDSKTLALYHPDSDSCVFAQRDRLSPPKKGLIKCYQQIGERCSGTNYCATILANIRNFPCKFDYGWKHFPIWFEFNTTAQWREDTESLFFIIVRNPYAWLASMNRIPHHAAPELYNIPFPKFIRSVWRLDPNLIEFQRFDIGPLTGTHFTNVIAMRTRKLRDWLYLQEAPNSFFINYETLRDYPYAVLAEMADLFDLDLKSVFSAALLYKNQRGEIYKKPKSDMPILSDRDRRYINRYLSPKIEMEYGYPLL